MKLHKNISAKDFNDRMTRLRLKYNMENNITLTVTIYLFTFLCLLLFFFLLPIIAAIFGLLLIVGLPFAFIEGMIRGFIK
jgi:hypothetical protein